MNNRTHGPADPAPNPPPGAGVGPEEAARLALPALARCASLLRHAAWCRGARRPCPFDEGRLGSAAGVLQCYAIGSHLCASYPAGSLERALGCVSDADGSLRRAAEGLRAEQEGMFGRKAAAPAAAGKGGAGPPPLIHRGDGGGRHADDADRAPQKQKPPTQRKPPASGKKPPAAEENRPAQQKPAAAESEPKRRRSKQLTDDARLKKRARRAARMALAPPPGEPRPQARSPAAAAGSLLENSRRSARDVLEARALVSSVAAACVSESIVAGDGGAEGALVESLVAHYRPRYAGLARERLRDAIRGEAGYEMWGGGEESVTTEEELRGMLPAVIERTDGLMEEYRRRVDGVRRRREEERRAAEEKAEKAAGSPVRKKKRKGGEGTEEMIKPAAKEKPAAAASRKRGYRRKDPHTPDEYLAALEAYGAERAAGGGPLDVPGDHEAEGGMKLGRWFHQQLDRFRRDGLERERYERMRELGVTFPGKGQFARGGRVKMTRDEEEYLEALRARAAAGRSLEMPASYETGDGLKLGQWLTAMKNKYRCGELAQERYERLREAGVNFPGRSRAVGGRMKPIKDGEDGGDAPLPFEAEDGDESPRAERPATAAGGTTTRSGRRCTQSARYTDSYSDLDDLLDVDEGEGEGSDSSDDDGLDLYPEGVERPSKRRKLRDDNDGYDDSSDDSDRSYRPSGVKKQRADDGGDDDEDGAGTSRKVPYSVRVKRARRGSTKYGTASNNYNTSQFDEDTPRGEMLTRLLEKYTEEKRNAPTVRRSRLLGFVEEIRAEDPGRYGPVETDPVKLKKKLSREYRRRNPGAAPHASRALVDEMYRRYSAVRRDLPPGAKVPRGCTAAIVEAVKAENPGVNLGAKDGSIKVVLHMRYAKEFPESKGLTGQKLTSTWDPEAKRRRERLYNEITLRYKRFRDANPKRIQEDTLGRIIRETMDDLDIHEFEVVPGSIRGRLKRKSLHVQKLGGGDRYRELDEPLVATLNGWLAKGMSVTRADGLNLANTLLRGNDLGDGSGVALGAHWWRAFLNRNRHRLNCEDEGSLGR